MLLLGCVTPEPVDVAPDCDPRALEAGEVRARPLLCTDELVSGGEGRVGDWLLENARVRFVVRGTYAALYAHDEGGTLIDAAEVGAQDLLGELRPLAERGDVEALNGDGWAELRLPGLAWHLDADQARLELWDDAGPAAFDAVALGLQGDERTEATWRSGADWIGLDGEVEGEGPVTLRGVGRVALRPEALWDDVEEVSVDTHASTILVESPAGRTRFGVSGGRYEGFVPAGATLLGERPGCTFRGLELLVCAKQLVQVRDDAGLGLVATVSDGVQRWVVRRWGGSVPVGPTVRPFEVYAGPGYELGRIEEGSQDGTVEVTLRRVVDRGSLLARFDLAAWPSVDKASWDVLHTAMGEGVDYAVVVAEDEVPAVARYAHDTLLARAASRAAGLVWSWPWTANARRPAHGSVPAAGLGALDLLTVSDGGTNARRIVAVTAAWVDAALAEAPPWAWQERPDALWLDGPEDTPAYEALLGAGIDAAPLGPYTWVDGADRNVAGVEAALLEGRTTAGTGPRLVVTEAAPAGPGTKPRVAVTLEIAHWLGEVEVTLGGPGGSVSVPLRSAGTVEVTVPGSSPWVYATAQGTTPAGEWRTGPTWAVSGPLWLDPPG